jgi:hypothetical protein
MTYLQRVNAHTDAQRRRRRYNVSEVLVHNNPPHDIPNLQRVNAHTDAQRSSRRCNVS